MSPLDVRQRFHDLGRVHVGPLILLIDEHHAKMVRSTLTEAREINIIVCDKNSLLLPGKLEDGGVINTAAEFVDRPGYVVAIGNQSVPEGPITDAFIEQKPHASAF